MSGSGASGQHALFYCDYCSVRFRGTLREILPTVAVTRTVLDIGCIAGGGGFDEPPHADRSNDNHRPAAMIAQTGFFVATAFLRRNSGNGNRITAKRGNEGHSRAVCL